MIFLERLDLRRSQSACSTLPLLVSRKQRGLALFQRVSLTAEQETEIIEGLEDILRRASPLGPRTLRRDAQEAAERFASYYQKHANLEEMRRLVRTYGGAFEALEAEANASLAIAWLAPVLDAHWNLGADRD